MKKTILFLLSLFATYYSIGQHLDTDYKDFVPPDLDSVWSFYNGCGSPLFNEAYTQMDTFRVIFRKPFSQYLLGDYYCGTIMRIDSITMESPFINKANDSICFVYALINVNEQYSSPYNQEIYLNPTPNDILYDSANGFQYYKQLLSSLDDTATRLKNVCILMTNQEKERIIHTEPFFSTKEILLRMTSEADSDSLNVVFCFQPFLNGYSKELLWTKEKIAMLKIIRYRQLYYDLFKKDLFEN